MNRIELSDGEWGRILAKLKKLPGIRVGLPDTCRQFISACLWILRSGSQWWVLPPSHGKWKSIFKRFSRWCANAVWGELHGPFSEGAGLQDVSMDGTAIRAHACAANSSAEDEALGRSKGGFGCKVHALCDALGMPIKFILTGGQEAACEQAIPLLENVKASAVLADKGYDTNELREWLKSQGIKAVIPPNRTGKKKLGVIIGIIRNMHSTACSASSSTIAGLPCVMRKKPLITWGCFHFPRLFYG
jgi:transposase